MAHSIQSPAVDVFSLFPPKKTNSAVVPLSTSKRIAYENFNSDESAHSSARSRIFLISSLIYFSSKYKKKMIENYFFFLIYLLIEKFLDTKILF